MHATQRSDPSRVARGRHWRRAAGVAIAIGAVTLCASGCGGSSPKASATSGASAGPHDGVNAAFRFSSCMRDHGVTNFPDPNVVSKQGSQAVMLKITPAISESPRFKSAQHACQSILPAPTNANPAQVAQQQHAREQDLLAFARCLRAHGVAGFPDPTSQGQLTLQMVHAAGLDLHAPDVLPAARDCVGVTHGIITGADVERAINGGG
jgi:hypothetical protein